MALASVGLGCMARVGQDHVSHVGSVSPTRAGWRETTRSISTYTTVPVVPYCIVLYCSGKLFY